MKTKKSFFILCLALLACASVLAQNNNDKTVQFTVSGNCGMCKNNIESSLKGVEGVKSAIWNKDTKIIKVVYDASRISEDQIHWKIVDAGYDTKKKKGSDKAYKALHNCCQYKRTLHQ